MPFLKAVYAFYRQLFEPECAHALVKPVSGGGVCPECGYHVQVVWHLIRCRSCGSKRHTKLMPDQQVKPLYKYCQHCGGLDYQVIKRQKIHVYEMPYASCAKEINYSEPVVDTVNYRYREHAARNPFEPIKPFATPPNCNPNIVEGIVLKKTETIRPGRVFTSG